MGLKMVGKIDLLHIYIYIYIQYICWKMFCCLFQILNGYIGYISLKGKAGPGASHLHRTSNCFPFCGEFGMIPS